jgi:hypothetical protein
VTVQLVVVLICVLDMAEENVVFVVKSPVVPPVLAGAMAAEEDVHPLAAPKVQPVHQIFVYGMVAVFVVHLRVVSELPMAALLIAPTLYASAMAVASVANLKAAIKALLVKHNIVSLMAVDVDAVMLDALVVPLLAVYASDMAVVEDVLLKVVALSLKLVLLSVYDTVAVKNV